MSLFINFRPIVMAKRIVCKGLWYLYIDIYIYTYIYIHDILWCHATLPRHVKKNPTYQTFLCNYLSHGTSEATPSKACKEVLRQKSVLQMAQKNLPTFCGKHRTSWKLSKHFETSFGPSLTSWKILSVGKWNSCGLACSCPYFGNCAKKCFLLAQPGLLLYQTAAPLIESTLRRHVWQRSIFARQRMDALRPWTPKKIARPLKRTPLCLGLNTTNSDKASRIQSVREGINLDASP